jgi:thioredoxin 1
LTPGPAWVIIYETLRAKKIHAASRRSGGFPGMAENMHEFTESNFEAEVLKAEKPVVIDFWAEWCVPCKMIEPAMEEIAKDNGDAVKVGRVNVDSNPGIASRYGIRSIPTLLIFKGGEVAEKMVGAVPKDTIQEFVNKVK